MMAKWLVCKSLMSYTNLGLHNSICHAIFHSLRFKGFGGVQHAQKQGSVFVPSQPADNRKAETVQQVCAASVWPEPRLLFKQLHPKCSDRHALGTLACALAGMPCKAMVLWMGQKELSHSLGIWVKMSRLKS